MNDPVKNNVLIFLPQPDSQLVLLVGSANRAQVYELTVSHAIFADAIREHIEMYSGEATFEQAHEVMVNVAQPVDVEPLELRSMMVNCMFQMFYSGMRYA